MLKTYVDRHGVRVKMNTTYILDAFTLRASENNMHMVLIMDTQIVQDEGLKHISYADYISKRDDELKDHEGLDLKSGRFF